ncbi:MULTISPECIES: Zn-dependent hydrolase [Oceanobacillus]|uniref:Zn-dependent hydrolase n=1 Tax=Oceanobacillus aidingensis TaxID=645964 RepID=A0ABV9K0W4_9BACI|nr:Zn-dependent hydrolase [Oceanobacillus oncorhynchi]MDM8102595.1 Zn-dependent hydrolase [Oceanobacillus oncorhynchi]UUI38918.1 Zn-dependent hydrolase [Oceanobacillus oncorhynchi]
MKANQERIEKHIKALSRYTATPNEGTTRLTYSEEDLQARIYIKEQMEAYGLEVREDGLGNIFGKLEGEKKDAPSVIVGSHFDSVPHGGDYDGPAGVIAGLEIAALFQDNQVKPVYPLEIIAMIEEEGSRFGGGLMGSRGIAGYLSKDDVQETKDKDGISVPEAMKKIGLDPSLEVKRDPETIKAFLEMHIEQGPILEEEQISVGVVESIVGLTQLEVTIDGKAGHAGTTPMDRRSDALVAAANIISKLPQIAMEEGEGTVTTVGRHQVFPNGANVIPDKVVFSVDIRSSKEAHVKNVVQKVKNLVRSWEANGIQTAVEQSLYMQPKELNKKIRSILEASCAQLGTSFINMHSGAGHDAMVLSDITDVGLIFVPSKDGLSHCPEEWTAIHELAAGIEVLYETALKLTEKS